jgi:hypothetical protein
MNAFYKISNVVIGTIFAAVIGLAIYSHATEVWGQLDETFVAASAVVGIVGTIVVGFLTLDGRVA